MDFFNLNAIDSMLFNSTGLRTQMRLPVLVLFFASFAAHSNSLSKKLDIEVNSSKNTTAVVDGKRMYVKTFELSIMSSGADPVVLTKENGCLLTEDNNGKKLCLSEFLYHFWEI